MKTDEKLPIEFKEKWVAALRSGDYSQVTGLMFDGIGYCCLGVACVVAGVTPKGKVITVSEGYTHDEMEKIPKMLTGSAMTNDVVQILTHKNDTQTLNFHAIADYIESNL